MNLYIGAGLDHNQRAHWLIKFIICLVQKYLLKAFLLVMRAMWPGIHGNAAGSAYVVSNRRKRAVQASRFMLQMMQAPLYSKETQKVDASDSTEQPEVVDGSVDPPLECGEEGLAIRIAVEVMLFYSLYILFPTS